MVMLTGPQPYARVYVPEAMRVSLAPGDDANIVVDGLGEVLRGRVRRVASASSFTPYFALTRHDRGRLSYVAEVDLPAQRHTLARRRPGRSVVWRRAGAGRRQ